MTDAAPTAPSQTPPPAAPSLPNQVGLVALILAAVGFIMGVIPATSGFAWLLFIPALVLSIVGLTRKGKKKGTSVAALVVTIIGWIIAIVVASATLIVGMGQAIESANDAPTAASEPADASAPTDGPKEAGLGDTVVSDDGVEFTVSAITCGLPSAGGEFLNETASGQFCEVKFTLLNGSNEAVNLYSSDFTGLIGEATYEANTTVSQFGDDMFSTDVNPGLSVAGTVYIDIPLDAALEFVEYKPIFSFGDGLIIRAS